MDTIVVLETTMRFYSYIRYKPLRMWRMQHWSSPCCDIWV